MLPDGLDTARLRLRTLSLADVPAALAAWGSDAIVARHLRWTATNELAEQQRRIARDLEEHAAGAGRWGMWLGETLVGKLNATPDAPGVIRVGYLVARPFWGQGIASEAVTAVVGVAREHAWRVHATVDPDNAASIRVLERAGLPFEGLARRAVVRPALGPDPRDTAIHATARDDPPPGAMLAPVPLAPGELALPETLAGEGCTLRRLRREDAAALHAVYGDPEAVRLLALRPAADAAAAARIAAVQIAAWDAGHRPYAVVVDGCVAGVVRATCTGPAQARLAIALARAHWGRGLAARAWRVLTDALLARGTWRVWADPVVEHGASRRALDKAGLALERVARRALLLPEGDAHDAAIHVRTR